MLSLLNKSSQKISSLWVTESEAGFPENAQGPIWESQGRGHKWAPWHLPGLVPEWSATLGESPAFHSKPTVTLLLLSEVGQRRTVLWAWRAGISRTCHETHPGDSLYQLPWAFGPQVRKVAQWEGGSGLHWLCCMAVVHSGPLRLALPSHAGGCLCLSPALALLCPVVRVFSPSFFAYSFYIVAHNPCLWGKFLELVQEWKCLY